MCQKLGDKLSEHTVAFKYDVDLCSNITTL